MCGLWNINLSKKQRNIFLSKFNFWYWWWLVELRSKLSLTYQHHISAHALIRKRLCENLTKTSHCEWFVYPQHIKDAIQQRCQIDGFLLRNFLYVSLKFHKFWTVAIFMKFGNRIFFFTKIKIQMSVSQLRIW